MADLNVTAAHGGPHAWPGPGDTVYVESRPLRIGGSVAHVSGSLFIPIPGSQQCVTLAEASVVCFFNQRADKLMEAQLKPKL